MFPKENKKEINPPKYKNAAQLVMPGTIPVLDWDTKLEKIWLVSDKKLNTDGKFNSNPIQSSTEATRR
jgi:hypothetical protein